MATITFTIAVTFPLGCAMILGRSLTRFQHEIFRIEEAKDLEIAFFKAHPELRIIPNIVGGADGLVALLSGVVQMRRIRGIVPKIKEKIHEAMTSASAKLAVLDPRKSIEENRAAKAKIWGTIAEVISDGTTGRYSHPFYMDSDLLLRAPINALLADFEATVNTTKPDFRAAEYVDDLVASGRKSRGPQLPGFINSRLFERRVARNVELWADGAINLCESVRVLMVTVACAVLQKFGGQVPRFSDQLLSLFDDVAQRLANEGRQWITVSLKIERLSIFGTRDRLFTDAVDLIPREKGSRKEAEKLGRASKDIISKALDDLQDSYQLWVTKFIQDHISSFRGIHQPFSSMYPSNLAPKIAVSFAKDERDKTLWTDVEENSNTLYTTFLAPTIQATFENTQTKKKTLDTNLDQFRKTIYFSAEPPLGTQSERAEADHLASMLEAYWQISSSRLVDDVIGHVTTCIVDGFPTQLDLKVQALLSNDASILAITPENPAVEKRRASLYSKIEGWLP
ncbi:Dynamin central region-domain-containing protein [Blyttiomyces helicus]|uniref:Dynamin central region-domain-containing protein n=1 Tax=Blyttiomyces helicus TaxID=388810 RepID=A0A4P9W756_9FUNG|nr:Dynamin central region-domain-containing protein [Blyttiomyces helicus]|eukprot:RKO87205.1 Dynamin central region-domain-containing protein [Blyttiomyces helicus]